MKNLLFFVLQFVVFFAVFAAFSLTLHPHIQSVIGSTPDGQRMFVWDGLLLSLALAVLILIIEAARKRIRRAGPWTSAAFILSTLCGFLLKFGLITHSR
jgi:hypothetical protein